MALRWALDLSFGGGKSGPGGRMQSSGNKIEFIQALRAVAVLAVVYYHWMGGDPFLERGYLGVDLFFVISGFIMVASTRNSDGSVSYAFGFIWRRFTRVWPAYFVLTAIVAALKILPNDKIDALSHFVLSVLLYPLWREQPVIPPGWSLPMEFCFYILFAVSLAFGRFRWAALAALMIFWLVAFPLAVTHTFSIFTGPPISIDGIWAYFTILSNPAMWSFFLGVGVFIVGSKEVSISRSVAWISLAVIVAGGFAFIPEGHTAVAGLFFAAAVLALTLANNRQRFSVPKWLIFIGDISYSLYLVHYPVKAIVNDTLFRFVHRPSQLWFLFAAYMALSLILAVASHYLLEDRLTSAIRNLSRSSKANLATGAASTPK